MHLWKWPYQCINIVWVSWKICCNLCFSFVRMVTLPSILFWLHAVFITKEEKSLYTKIEGPILKGLKLVYNIPWPIPVFFYEHKWLVVRVFTCLLLGPFIWSRFCSSIYPVHPSTMCVPEPSMIAWYVEVKNCYCLNKPSPIELL